MRHSDAAADNGCARSMRISASDVGAGVTIDLEGSERGGQHIGTADGISRSAPSCARKTASRRVRGMRRHHATPSHNLREGGGRYRGLLRMRIGSVRALRDQALFRGGDGAWTGSL